MLIVAYGDYGIVQRVLPTFGTPGAAGISSPCGCSATRLAPLDVPLPLTRFGYATVHGEAVYALAHIKAL